MVRMVCMVCVQKTIKFRRIPRKSAWVPPQTITKTSQSTPRPQTLATLRVRLATFLRPQLLNAFLLTPWAHLVIFFCLTTTEWRSNVCVLHDQNGASKPRSSFCYMRVRFTTVFGETHEEIRCKNRQHNSVNVLRISSKQHTDNNFMCGCIPAKRSEE